MLKRIKDHLGARAQAEDLASALPALMIEAQKIADAHIHGLHDRKKAGQGEKFWQFRPYAQGDRPQDIDWRQSAKTDQVFIKQKEWQNTQRTYFWCAHHKGMDFASRKNIPSKQNFAQLITLTLAILLTCGDEYIGNFGDLKTSGREAGIERITRPFLGPHKNEFLPNSTQFTPPNNSALILCGDFLSPLEEIKSCFDRLSVQGLKGITIQILDPVELNLDLNGRILFEGLDGQQELINQVEDVRSQYVDRITAHNKEIEKLCLNYGWTYILADTQAPPEKIIEDILFHLMQSYEV